jgi:hypothetical protein
VDAGAKTSVAATVSERYRTTANHYEVGAYTLGHRYAPPSVVGGLAVQPSRPVAGYLVVVEVVVRSGTPTDPEEIRNVLRSCRGSGQRTWPFPVRVGASGLAGALGGTRIPNLLIRSLVPDVRRVHLGPFTQVPLLRVASGEPQRTRDGYQVTCITFCGPRVGCGFS